MDYLKIYQSWVEEPTISKEMKEQLALMSKNDIEDSFYKHLSFGTAGARGLMGPGTNRLNEYTVKKIVKGFAHYLLEIPNAKEKGIVISYDNRINSQSFAALSAGVLASFGIKTYVTKELRPTPFLSFLVRHFEAAGGIMITASHNPKTDNGFKAYDEEGCQLVPSLANKLIAHVEAVETYFDIKADKNSNLITWVDGHLDDLYLSEVKKISLENIMNKSMKIVYSPLHGTGATMIPKLLKEEGYQIYPLASQMTADGEFTNTKSSNPEEKLAYEGALAYARELNADLVVLTDPDADRLGVVVKHRGSYHFLNGNQTASLTLEYILNRRKANDLLPKNGFVFSTNVSTPLMTHIANAYGVTMVTTLTGFKFIGQKAKEIEQTGTYLFGCEESYGSLISDFVRDKDAVQAVYMLAEMINYYNQSDMTLIDQLEVLYETYGFILEETIQISLKGIEGQTKIDKIMAQFRAHPLSMKNKELIQIDDNLTQSSWTKVGINKIDLPTS
ncbi:MAG TPA: phospho-sugar mutase, partial [Acholeplasma sp.]|nr:phospho-sugar mutase [Acholeplasma sp.]